MYFLNLTYPVSRFITLFELSESETELPTVLLIEY
jgi:hypothetical protein